MRIVDPAFTILNFPDSGEMLRLLELAARTCYKSEDKIGEGTAEALLSRIVGLGHESVIEHASVSVRFTCDRGVTHELVRHRLASYSQESTRYANYSKDKFGNEITVIRPFFFAPESIAYKLWEEAMQRAEAAYLALIDTGAKAQEARSVLPNSLKTEIVMTANLREWRHVFRLRCASPAHPQIRQIMLPLLAEFGRRLPVLFGEQAAAFAEDIADYAAKAPLAGTS